MQTTTSRNWDLFRRAYMNHKRQKILITGGAGYIGTILTGVLLKESYHVRVLDNLMHGGEPLLPFMGDEHFEFLKGDVREKADVSASLEGVDVVVHLAAIVGDPASQKIPKETREINLNATKRLVDMAKERGIKRLIFLSTCSNYGISDSEKLSDENSPLNPISLYAETKVEAEKYVLSSQENGFEPCVLRGSTVFGTSPRMRFDLTINQFVMEALRDKKLVIFAPELWRPYIHIRDFADVIRTVIEAPGEMVSAEVYNVGSNEMSFKKITIADFVKNHIPDTEVKIVDKGDDLRDYRVSFEKLANTFSFVPRRTLSDGIKEIKNVVEHGVISDFENRQYYNV
jgi:nucleoside-diphosphate-sugar epimerase